MPAKELFIGAHLREFLEDLANQMRAEIEGIPIDAIAAADPNALAQQFVEKYQRIAPTLLNSDEPRAEELQAVNLDSNACSLSLRVQFAGDAGLLRYRPRHYAIPMCHVGVGDGYLTFIDGALKADLQRGIDSIKVQIGHVKAALDTAAQQVKVHNDSLHEAAMAVINRRRKQFQEHEVLNKKLAAMIPIQRRNDAIAKVIIPVSRKVINLNPPGMQAVPSVAEPQIAIAAYDDILQVIHSMSQVLERSPTVFKDMPEEHLRTILLVGLNGIFEGKATAETFNGTGKTDILVRVHDKNVFVAECLIWQGAEALRKKMDEQLFQYATWRDSKLALIVFNRRRDFSAVVKKVFEVCDGHPQRIQSIPFPSQTGFRFRFKRADDAEREFLLTAITFNVPN